MRAGVPTSHDSEMEYLTQTHVKTIMQPTRQQS
ncbi:protein of unknown function [Candidatus Methylomirabilis oxygeniifera]|uniref:Uncharacterized protein n=1 Tax=Methylomirabilis oxygeniifera TaxID=671143 RepID=D5MF54_METO1|nr:protein of unknown function [Candidatus Methylomirabilis oxyfera]